MRKTLRAAVVGSCAAALTLALAPGASAQNNGQGKKFGKVAAKQCQIQRKALGNKAFRDAYEGRSAMRRCLGITKKTARRNASRMCREERGERGVADFRDKYGTNENKRNAFGKCVSQKRIGQLIRQRNQVRNAARQCRAERNSMTPQEFQDEYGTNDNKRNAFGKCVSQKARAAANNNG